MDASRDTALSPADILADDELRRSVYQHAMDWFPKEACGLLLESEGRPEVVLADNLADKYHALDPETYPRTAERAYLLDPRLIAQAESDGKRLVAIWHSHVRVGAYFSEEDTFQALSPFDEGPLYPGVDYVVVDAQDEGVKGFKTFAWSDEAKAFVEKP